MIRQPTLIANSPDYPSVPDARFARSVGNWNETNLPDPASRSGNNFTGNHTFALNSGNGFTLGDNSPWSGSGMSIGVNSNRYTFYITGGGGADSGWGWRQDIAQGGYANAMTLTPGGNLTVGGTITSGGGLNDSGEYAFAAHFGTNNVLSGTIVSGSVLQPATAAGDAATAPFSGSWECRGRSTTSSFENRTTLWKKV